MIVKTAPYDETLVNEGNCVSQPPKICYVLGCKKFTLRGNAGCEKRECFTSVPMLEGRVIHTLPSGRSLPFLSTDKIVPYRL
jgi:hypothetical protein